MVDYYKYPCIALTGGTDGALDAIDGSLLKDGDSAYVDVPSTQMHYVYVLDADSAGTESSPYIIAPDANAGDKRWILTHKSPDVINAEDYGVVPGNTIDNTTALNTAIAACNRTTGTSTLILPPGWIRCDGQVVVNVSGIVIRGQGRSAANASWGTVLDLRYAAGHAVMISGATQKLDIAFENMHIYQGDGGNYYCFESRHVRGLFFRNITFGGVYGFLKAGRTSEPTLYVSFEGIEGNMRETGTPVHEHFVDAVNLPGMLFFTGSGHVEGYTTWPVVSAFLNYGDASVAADGIQIGNWTIRNFSYLFDFRNGVGNFFANNVIGDFCDYGFYADSDTGEVIGINLNGCRFAGGPSSTGASHGIVIFKTTELTESIQINGCLVRDFGRYGIWVNGAMDVTIVANKIQNVGQQTTNTYDGMRIGSSVTGQVVGNAIRSSVANVHRYGIMIDSAETNLMVTTNTSMGHGTLPIGNNERASAADRVVKWNTGQGVAGKYVVGAWTFENAANNVSGDPMTFAFGGGSTSTQHFRAIRRGRLVGLSGSVNGAVTAGAMTLSAGINGSSNANLTVALNNTNEFKTGTYDVGIAFNASDSISVRYATTANFAPTTLDALAFLEIVDD